MNVLVVGPHPDDQELAMGGTIARLASEGHRVLLLDLTDGEPTPHGSPEIRAREADRAASILGVERRLLGRDHGFVNREVVHSVACRHAVAAVLRTERIDWIFCPHPEDAHPDHRAATRIVEDARFDAKLTRTNIPGEPRYPSRLVHYYATHLKTIPDPSFLVDTSASTIASGRRSSPTRASSSPTSGIEPSSTGSMRRPGTWGAGSAWRPPSRSAWSSPSVFEASNP